MRTVVLGLGNLLLGDEGVGVHAAGALAAAGDLPPEVEVLDVGTALLDALPALERADRVIVIDAVTAGGTPGSVYRLPHDHVLRKPVIAGLHGFDLARVLALGGNERPPEDVVVLGVEPAVMSWSLDLSPPVAAALPFLLEAVRAEVRRPPSAPRRQRADDAGALPLPRSGPRGYEP